MYYILTGGLPTTSWLVVYLLHLNWWSICYTLTGGLFTISRLVVKLQHLICQSIYCKFMVVKLEHMCRSFYYIQTVGHFTAFIWWSFYSIIQNVLVLLLYLEWWSFYNIMVVILQHRKIVSVILLYPEWWSFQYNFST